MTPPLMKPSGHYVVRFSDKRLGGLSDSLSRPCGAFTRLEFIALLAVIALLLTLVIPALAATQAGTYRAVCANNLGRIGQALNRWGNEHGERYPWYVNTSEGGSLNANVPSRFVASFQALSNELVTPRVLICPADASRTPAGSFDPSTGLDSLRSSSQINYFIAHPALRQERAILSGDSNWGGSVTASCFPFGTAGAFPSTNGPYWNLLRHASVGQLLFNDGSVESVGTAELRSRIAVPGTDNESGFHYLDASLSP